MFVVRNASMRELDHRGWRWLRGLLDTEGV